MVPPTTDSDTDRPLARDEDAFRRLHAERRSIYAAAGTFLALPFGLASFFDFDLMLMRAPPAGG